MGKILFTFFLLLWALPAIAVENNASIDACDFDLKVIDEMRNVQSRARTLHQTDENYVYEKIPELLDYIAEAAPNVSLHLCKDKSKQDLLTKKVRALFSKTQAEGEYFPRVYTSYRTFYGREINGRVLSVEDNAFYNLLLDYFIAKYDMFYSYSKKTMLKKNSTLLTGSIAEYMVRELIRKDVVTDVAKAAVKSPQAVASEIGAAWAYLWVRNDNPYSHESYYDMDYEWLLFLRDQFLKAYPESHYRPALESMVTQDIAEALHEADKKSPVLGLSIGLAAGKSFMSSAFDPVQESFTFSIPHARIQVYNVIVQIQVDAMISGKEISAAGFDGLLGYTFEYENYALDILGGIGFDEFYMEKDSVMTFAFMGGAQLLKRFPVGDLVNITPKIEWLVKGMKFDDPVKNRKKWGAINQLLLGISVEMRQPLNKVNLF